MAAKVTIKKKRLRQLYAQGLSMPQIAELFGISSQAVSKALDRKTAAAGLQKQHVAHRNLDKKLRAGESRPRMRSRVRELYALGLRIAFVVSRLKLSEQVVTEMIEGDAEIERLHTARVALDGKLIAGESVTEADFAVDQVAPRPDGNRRRDASGDDRGEPTPSRAQAAVAEDAESAADGHSESATAERPETQPPGAAESATAGQPEVQPPGAAESATAKRPEVQPREAAESATQKAKPTSSWRDVQRLLQEMKAEREAEKAEAAATAQLVIKHVGAEYGYHPTQFTGKETTPEFEEARQVAMFIAVRDAGLSSLQLGEIFDCDPSTIQHADTEVLAIFCVDETRRNRILRVEALVRPLLALPRASE